MKRRYLALLIIPFMLLLCGCNEPAKRLTPEEYTEAMDNAWDEYRDEGYGVFLKISLEVGNDFSKMHERKAEILEACDKMDAAMEKFKEMNPPAEYQYLHEKLTASIDDEKRWNEYRRRGFSAETEEEADEYFGKIAEEVNAMDSDESFPHIYLEIYQKTHNLDY